jgi:4'-phosphopantetheinyl transferase
MAVRIRSAPAIPTGSRVPSRTAILRTPAAMRKRRSDGRDVMKLCCAGRGGLTGTQAVYALLEYMVTTAYGIPMPRVKKHRTGKPYFPDRPDICFSLSHTSSHVLCAVSARPVGADIETVRSVRPGVAERVCTPDELGAFDFFELWVLKESFLKLSGRTDVSFKKLCFARDGDAIVTPDGSVTARLFGDIPGCRAAVCSLGDDIPETIERIELPEIAGNA